MNRWQHSGPPSRLQRFYEKHTGHGLTSRGLRQQCRLYRGTGGASEDNRAEGFIPAFLNRENGEVHLYVSSDGQVCSVHTLDGLPDSVVVRRNRNGMVTAVRSCIVAGFVRNGHFYTREQAAEEVSQRTTVAVRSNSMVNA